MRAALASLAVAGATAACAHLPTGSDGLGFEQRRAEIVAVPDWEMRGRLAVDTGDGGFQGSFQWRQHADTIDLLVRGPLGGGVLRVAGTPAQLTVMARGETHVLKDPEPELSELVGWWLPVESLHSWLLGLPDAHYPASTRPGTDGTLAGFEQRLWNVEYSSYQLAPVPGAAGTGTLVPRRIDLEHGALKLKLTVDDWRAATATGSP